MCRLNGCRQYQHPFWDLVQVLAITLQDNSRIKAWTRQWKVTLHLQGRCAITSQVLNFDLAQPWLCSHLGWTRRWKLSFSLCFSLCACSSFCNSTIQINKNWPLLKEFILKIIGENLGKTGKELHLLCCLENWIFLYATITKNVNI